MASPPKTQPSITVYRGWAAPGAYVWSPFVSKLEARLRFAGLSYAIEAGSFIKAPNGKVPYIAISKTDSGTQSPVNTTILPDSALIVEHLVKEGLLDDLNAGLSPTEKAYDLALRALLEDKLYFYQVYERWVGNYYTMRPHALSMVPYLAQLVLAPFIYRKVVQTLHSQGTSRLSAEEISSFRREVWVSIDALLVASKKKNTEAGVGDEPFWVLGGDGPTEADTALFGFLASAFICNAGPESLQLVKSLQAAEDYARRIHSRYFPDYAWPSS